MDNYFGPEEEKETYEEEKNKALTGEFSIEDIIEIVNMGDEDK